MRYLTKSRFKLALECPTKLFYTGKTHKYADCKADDEFLRMLAEGGHQVGELAKQRYPQGHEIKGADPQAAIAQTQRALAAERIVLFEPAIAVGPYLVRVDILVKEGDHFELIEVKAKSFDPDKAGFLDKSDMLPYLQDAAFQQWVLQQAFPQASIRSFLMLPNKREPVPVDGLNQMFRLSAREGVVVRKREDVDLAAIAEKMLVRLDVSDRVAAILSQPLELPTGPMSFDEAAARFAEHYQRDERIEPRIGRQCADCQFRSAPGTGLRSGFHECWMHASGWNEDAFPDTTVLDLWYFTRKQQLIDQGILTLDQVEPEHLGLTDPGPSDDGLTRVQRQWLQVDGIPETYAIDGAYFDAALMARHMAQWRFPLHMIDFETASLALPFHRGMRPYEALAFQFSHHVIERDGSVRHAHEFLCVAPGEFPNYAFVRALREAIGGDEGSVFMWSTHERTILNAIAKQLQADPAPPPDATELVAFIKCLDKDGARELIDLCRLAEKGFYHPSTRGSCSIKKVLPAVLHSSVAVRTLYARPVYGAPDGIPSRNYADDGGMAWFDPHETHPDPYARLRRMAEDLLPVGVATPEERASIIAEGGAASTAYARLQFEDLDIATRERIASALLRYCELDTLAMVMVVQAWQTWLRALGHDAPPLTSQGSGSGAHG